MAALGAGDLEDADPAAGFKHAVELGKRGVEVWQMPKGVTHRDKVEGCIGERNCLPHTDHGRRVERLAGLFQHAGAGVDPDDATFFTDEFCGFATDEAGAHGDVEHRHAG